VQSGDASTAASGLAAVNLFDDTGAPLRVEGAQEPITITIPLNEMESAREEWDESEAEVSANFTLVRYNFCAGPQGEDLAQRVWPDGNGSLYECQVECVKQVSCSGIEWYETPWYVEWREPGINITIGQEHRCFLINQQIMFNDSMPGDRWRDAECYTKQGGNCLDQSFCFTPNTLYRVPYT